MSYKVPAWQKLSGTQVWFVCIGSPQYYYVIMNHVFSLTQFYDETRMLQTLLQYEMIEWHSIISS